MTRLVLTGALLTLVCAACATVPVDSGFPVVQRLAGERLEQRLYWRRGAGAELEAEIDALLASELSADAALQVALLSNRHLQAAYESLGIAQADLVQAGLLRNPVFIGRAGFPDRAPTGVSLELAVVQDFLDELLRASRRQIAELQFEETQVDVVARILDLAREVRTAYYAALCAEQVSAMRKLVVDAAEASAELARRLHAAGNFSDLQFTSELGLYENTRLAWARSESERLAAREALNRLLGLFGTRVAWKLPGRLPDLPEPELAFESLERRAISRRPELTVARKHSEALARALGVTRDWRFLAAVDVGVSADRDTDGQWVTGPELSLPLPISMCSRWRSRSAPRSARRVTGWSRRAGWPSTTARWSSRYARRP